MFSGSIFVDLRVLRTRLRTRRPRSQYLSAHSILDGLEPNLTLIDLGMHFVLPKPHPVFTACFFQIK